MYPILRVGPAAIQLPGLILLLGFWICLSLAGRQANKAGLAEDAIFNAGFLGLLAGLLGARLGYVALHWSVYQYDLPGIFALTAGALSTPAGVGVGLATTAVVLSFRRPPVPRLLDALAPAFALLFAFISLADLCSGSAYGAVSDVPWAIELWGARRHPTQIYELLAALATLGLLSWARTRRPYEGFLFLLFLLSYGVARLFLEAFRAAPWLFWGGYRIVQLVSLALVVLSLWLMSQRAVQKSKPSNGLS